MPTSTKEQSVNIAALDEILSKRARVEPLAEPRLLPVGKAVSDARPKHIRVGRLRPERVDPIQSDSSSFGDWGHYLLLVAALLLGAYSLTLCLPTSSRRTPQSSLASPAATASAKPRFEIVSKPIETIEPFERVAGRNPQLSDEDRDEIAEPDPQSWRVLRLEMTKSNGRPLRIKLARPVEWIDAVGAVEGSSFFLDLPEMGAVGLARVLTVEPAPPLEAGDGNIVTGVFEHEADESVRILSLDFSNGAKIHGVTANHPFWSENRQMFVPVGELREGDRVRVRDGTTSIVSIRGRYANPGERLYNLEVYGQHVYAVTDSGVLVHNSCITDIRFRGARGIDSLRTATHHDIVKAFSHTGFKPSNHFISRLKDIRTERLGLQTFNDLEGMFRNGRVVNANNGLQALVHRNMAIIFDQNTGVLVTLTPW